MRLWQGPGIDRLVYVGYGVEGFGIDSHMLFVFPQPDSLVPVFTLDAVFMSAAFASMSGQKTTEDTYAFHLDLVPRCDPGTNLEYLRRCYQPLDGVQIEVDGADGISPALISQTQRAVMSPWMLVGRASGAAWESRVAPATTAYLDHWLGLLDQGLEDLRPSMNGIIAAQRDRENRRLLFSREVDPVWEKMDRMVTAEKAEVMRRVLLNGGHPEEDSV